MNKLNAKKNDFLKVALHKLKSFLLMIFAPILGDELFLKLKWKQIMGYSLNLKNPITFNEKLQWLKLYNRNPEYTRMVDKYEAKEYVASIIGKEHVIPTIAVYDRAEDIDFNALPNQFVLKCTHDSGGIVICRDKSQLDKKTAIKKLKKGLKHNFYWQFREWPYKNVKPRIIAEQYLDDENGDLNDYKLMCYNGKCKNLFVCSGRSKKDLRVDFFDVMWNHLPFKRKYDNADYEISCPDNLEEMIKIAEKLSTEIKSPFVRIDFYNIDRKIYFGEITFFPGSGYEIFSPISWDYKLGNLINLSPILS